MWSQMLLCLLVGLAYASINPAWKDNNEYVYQVRARTLTSLHEVSNDYSGIFLKAKLIVRPRSDGVLNARISEPQYAQVHANLAQGWETIIPDSELAYKELPISHKPFEIVMKNGAVRDLIVSKEISNWEANIIKSIVSQFQLDTQAENLIPSHVNILTQDNSNNAVYKTMEETVTGVAETLYEIHPMPEYALQSQPWMVPQRNLRGDGETIEIVKSKNYTRAEERPAYHFGFSGIGAEFEPTQNKVGQFLTRSSVSRAIVTGSLKRFTIQSAVTVDRILISPTMNDQQKGSVNSMLNVTLISVQQQTEQLEQLSSPVALGSLVYRFDSPYATSNQVRSGKQNEHQLLQGSAEANSQYRSSEESNNSGRNKRSNDHSRNLMNRGLSYGSDDSMSSEEEYWQQEQPRLTEAPESPLLPFTVGFEGQALKKKHNIVENVRKLAQQIGQEYQQLEKIPQQNTIGKFVILTSLLRIMDHNEMQQVAAQLYNKQHEQNAQSASWMAFRDAVAQSGTGPALVCIQDWIKTNKVQGEEAAELVSTAAFAARQPTEEYMRTFYQMVKSSEIMQHAHLNESVLLCYTELAHKVYVNKDDSHSNYPVHSFGTFRTNKGKNFLKNEVIAHLTQQLHDAISESNTQKIHAYIRALGNVGHQQILEAFEPYLEGKKQASQFQRVLMVVALDKLATSNPKVARSVLYKIYQNSAEYEQVRVAAVYQLMRTSPSADLLQRMATYTNADASQYVNSAVKSAIESAAQLKGDSHAYLRDAARSAQHLLTTKNFGAQYSRDQLRSYVVKEMNLSYKQSFRTFGSEDSILPKGLKYSLRASFGGMQKRLINLQAMVSSIDDLTHVLEQQTEEYKQQKEQKQSQGTQQQQWSSENIAKLLSMQYEQREQLEGNFHFQMGSLQKIFSFDNRSIEMLPQVLREIEEALKEGQDFHYNKMWNTQEQTIAFPTELGMPFFYKYDRPALVHIQGKIRASANPKVSSGQNLRKPDNVEGEFELHVVISGKAQSQLGFITPFDHQSYSAGYDKNFQMNLPISGKVQIDVQNSQMRTEIKPLQNNKDVQLLHYSTWPYTSKDGIFTTQPTKQIIRKEQPQRINTIVGQKSTGIALNLDLTSDTKMNFAWLYEKLQHHDCISALLSPWVDERIQFTEVNVKLDSDRSSTDKVLFRFGYQHKYQSHQEGDNNNSNQENDISNLEQISEEPLKRQAEFMKRVGADIHSVQTRVVDAVVEFHGQQNIKYIATVASAKSNADPKGRFLVQIKKQGGQGKNIVLNLSAKSHIANTNGLDLTEAMKIDPTFTTQFQASLGENFQTSLKINGQVQYRKSEQREQYLQQQPEYKECQRQMQDGNNQLPACAKMTARANLLDHVSIKFDYENVQPQMLSETYKWYNMARHTLTPRLEANIMEEGTGKDQIKIEGQLNKELNYVNFSIRTKHTQVQIMDVPVNKWARELFVPHPVFHIRSRLMGQAQGYQAYRPICVVDKTAASTFDNKTYPLTLSKQWTVLLQYVPRHAAQNQEQQTEQSVEQQLKQQVENYVVLARASEQGAQKEIKIVIQTPETQGKLVEITLKPTGSQQYPKLYVNGEEVKYNDQQSSDFYGGYLQVYGLPNGEVKAEIYEAFYIIYDGQRAKLTIVDNKFRDATRGLCGTFTGQKQTDFLSARNCILRNPEEFIASYTVLEQGQQNQRIAQLKQHAEQAECYQKEVKYVNVISTIDTGRMRPDQINKSQSRGSCTKLQTQYVVEDNETCFTRRPLPICKPGCQAHGIVSKKVSVHCVKSTSATQLWMNEITKGASPDFSLKHESRTIKMDVPQRCSA